jgi:hypothetical protein
MLIGALLIGMLTGPDIVRAHGKHTFDVSPDHKYVAITAHGEADCSYLFVEKLRGAKGEIPAMRRWAEQIAMKQWPKVSRTTTTRFFRMDVESFLWVPEKPHTLAYGENQIYGEGIVGLVEIEKKRRVLVSPPERECEIKLVSFDPIRSRLTYKVIFSTDRYDHWVTKTRHLVIISC